MIIIKNNAVNPVLRKFVCTPNYLHITRNLNLCVGFSPVCRQVNAMNRIVRAGME